MSEVFNGIADGHRLGKQIGGGISQGLSVALYLLARPVVLSTQVFFRQKLGQRYFSSSQAIGAVFVILLVSVTDHFTAGLQLNHIRGSFYDRDPDVVAHGAMLANVVGSIWLAGFLGRALWHFKREVPFQQYWHSRCDGVPWHHYTDYTYQYLAVVVLAVIFGLMGLKAMCVLLLLSILWSAMARSFERAQWYNKMLDIVDAQIERDWLAKAIEEKLPAGQAEGLSVSLPAHVTDEFRQKVAKLVE